MSLGREQEKSLFQLCGVLVLGAGLYLAHQSPFSISHKALLQTPIACGIIVLGFMLGLIGMYGGGWPRDKAEWSAMLAASLRGLLALVLAVFYLAYQGASPVWLWAIPISGVLDRFFARLFAWLSQPKVEA